MAGRPSKLTPECQAKLVAGVKLGLTYDLAAAYASITYTTLRTWLVRAESGEQPYLALSEAIKQAEGEGAAVNMANIAKAAKEGKWQASAWIMERRYPSKYGRRVQEMVEKKSDDSKAVKDMTDAELEKEIVELADNIRKSRKRAS